MLFAFVLSLIPLLAAAGTTIPTANGKYTPKPSSWMLKPLSADDKHYKPSSRVATTSMPVSEYTYWLVQAYYSSTGMYCNADDVIMKFAIPSYSCQQTGEFTSMQYQCYSEYYCALYEYSDSYCGNVLMSYSVNLYICQAGDADDDGYVTDDGNQFTSQQLMSQMGFPVALPGNSTTITYYSSTYCDQSSMSYYRLAYPNRCYNNFDGENRTSTQYLEPNLLSYNASGCDSSNIDGSVAYPPGLCQVDYATSTSSMLVLNYPVPATVPMNMGAIVGATVGGFAALALLDTLLYMFVPPQSSSSSQATAPQAEKGGEF